MGWVRRPVCSRSWSFHSPQFGHGMLGEEIRRAAPAVSSHTVALAPFSQNSKGGLSPGLAQAQATHMKPSGLFCRRKVSSAAGRIPFLAEDTRDTPERSPAAGRSIIFDGVVFFDGVIFTFKWGVGFRHDTYLQSIARQPLVNR